MSGKRILCTTFLACALCGAAFACLSAADPVKIPNNLAQYDQVIEPADREHWAYRPVARPPIPAVKRVDWALNPLDRFILSRLEKEGWNPNPPAERQALLRRVSLDVVGLPPGRDEQARFLGEVAPGAWERLIDRLLADPGYGERWGRHWLDLVRYAETNGYERDAAKPHVWRYRDWVIDSLNADQPYNRFVLEQLAGDELDDANAETVIATGFNRLGPWDDEPADPEEDRFDQLDDLVRTTSQAFLGLTLGCARCHNHKFDALTAHDYYRLVAVFRPLERPQNGRTELDAPAVPANAPQTANTLRGYFLREGSSKPPITHLLLRGRATSPGPVVEPGVPAVLVASQPDFAKAARRTTRRRLTFARWLIDEHNPLTPRVIVNRVWQGHFGQGLVHTSSDFGVMGSPPTHPELLDWLADWFMHDAHWSLKKLHRLILTSNAYRMSKRIRPEYAAADPENEKLWRFPYQRLEVEAIRDSMLAANGQLRRTMHGPSIHLAIPKEALASNSDPNSIWPAFQEQEAARRTVYAFVKRGLVVPMLDVLDLCDTTKSAERRNITSVPTQALTLLNGDEVNRQSHWLAVRVKREVGDDLVRQVERAFSLVLCRAPTPKESADLAAFAQRDGLEHACRVIYNLNEFVYSD